MAIFLSNSGQNKKKYIYYIYVEFSRIPTQILHKVHVQKNLFTYVLTA